MTPDVYIPSTSGMPPLLVDMDGTLVDSTAVVETTWRNFATRHGLDVQDILAFAHGRPPLATTSHFLSNPLEAADLQSLEEEIVAGIVEVPGAAASWRPCPASDGRWSRQPAGHSPLVAWPQRE